MQLRQAVSQERTLVDDWRVRRERLATSREISAQYREMQLQLLDYLISRYGDSSTAARPARFAAPSGVYWNDRAIVVHHHLQQATVSGVKNQGQANRRVGEILGHLRAVQDDLTGATPDRENFDVPADRPELSTAALVRLSRALRYRTGVRWAIAAALDESPYLPRAALAWLCRRLSDPRKVDAASAELLARCRGDEAINYAVRAWRERLAADCDDRATEKLRAYLSAETENVDRIRERLADVSPRVRIHAARLLGEIGTLDDVALCFDLLSLPTVADETSDERQAILDAMRQLAERP